MDFRLRTRAQVHRTLQEDGSECRRAMEERLVTQLPASSYWRLG
jgi:hypothetical protein